MSNPNPRTDHLVQTHWKKGQSGNPGGVPKNEIPDWKLARRHSQEAIEKILEFMRGEVNTIVDGKSKKFTAAPTLQLMAAQMILERGWGKAPQALNIKDERADDDGGRKLSEKEALEFIESTIAGISARLKSERSPKIIDHERGSG